MIKFKIVLENTTIEFATEAEAQSYKLVNNLSQEIESFIENIATLDSVPLSVSPRQIRIALILSGINLETVESFIENLPEPKKSITKVTWEYSVEFQRNNPILTELAPTFGLSEVQIDQIFKLASTV